MIHTVLKNFAPHKFVKRTFGFLYPIECPDESIHDLEDNSEGSQAQNNQSSSEEIISNNDDDVNGIQRDDGSPGKQHMIQTVCPKRRAVIKARQRIQQWLNSDEEASVGSTCCGSC